MENPAEVQEVRNKLRMMKFPQDEILNVVRRQQRALHKQKQANDTIRGEIDQYEKQIANIDREIHLYKTSEDLQRLQTTRKNLTNRLSVLTADYNAEEAKRRKLEDEVSVENSKAGGFFQQSRENEELQARLRTMENRLDKALVRYNRNLTKLGELRARIDELRKDRRSFRQVVKTTEERKARSDMEIGNLISTSNEAYSERDRHKMELLRLKSAEKTDVKAFEEELTRLNQQIEGKKIAQGATLNQVQTVPTLNSQLGSQAAELEEIDRITKKYEDENQRTLDIMGMKSVEELIAEADRLERENYSLFSFVVEHGATRTRLQEEIDGLELQKEQLLAQTEDNEVEQSEELANLTREIQVVDGNLKEVRSKRAKNEADFASVYSDIESIFTMLKCSWDEAPDGKTSVTPANAMFCLSAIETELAAMMNDVLEKTRMECGLREIQPSSFLPEEPAHQPALVSRHITQTRAVQEKELAGKVADTTKPLSMEEMMAMINDE